MFRIATWNLERCSPRAWRKAPAQDARMAEVDADVWVLTETFTTRSPVAGFHGVFCPPHPERRPHPDERWTAIWSRWPIEVVDNPAPHRRGTVAALLTSPIGPLLVYGTVIAYAHEPTHDDGRSARAWEVHAAEIERQATEWQRLRERFPDVPLVVAGDMNQGRDGRRWSYGTAAHRAALTDAFARDGLRSLTDVDLVATGLITERGHVQHIAVSEGIEVVGAVEAWDRRNVSGVRLSDHPTLAVDVEMQ